MDAFNYGGTLAKSLLTWRQRLISPSGLNIVHALIVLLATGIKTIPLACNFISIGLCRRTPRLAGTASQQQCQTNKDEISLRVSHRPPNVSDLTSTRQTRTTGSSARHVLCDGAKPKIKSDGRQRARTAVDCEANRIDANRMPCACPESWSQRPGYRRRRKATSRGKSPRQANQRSR